MQNGIVNGIILVFLGALLSWYTGMLLIAASSYTNRVRTEDIAKVLFGKKFAVTCAVLNIVALVGFNMSYTVYVRIK